MDSALGPILTLALGELALALLLVLAVRLRSRALVGTVCTRQRGSRRVAMALLVGLVALAVTSLVQGELDALPLLLLAGLVTWAQPVRADGAFGSDGVHHGWRARPLAELEEWRLTGDHLRVRLADEWVAVHLPRDRQQEARQRLQESCADRESRFRA